MDSTTEKFDTKDCKTHRVFGTDVYWCLANKSNHQVCQYAMSFGYSYMCRHPDRNDFVEHKPLQQAQL